MVKLVGKSVEARGHNLQLWVAEALTESLKSSSCHVRTTFVALQGRAKGGKPTGTGNCVVKSVASPSNSGSSADLMALRAAACAASGSALTESSGGLGGIVGDKLADAQRMLQFSHST